MVEVRNRRIILFLGAGASAPFGYPTTQSFLDGLKDEMGESVESMLLLSLLKVPHVKDVERVLELLEALQVFKNHPLKEFTTTFQTSISLPMITSNLSDQLKMRACMHANVRSRLHRTDAFSDAIGDAGKSKGSSHGYKTSAD